MSEHKDLDQLFENFMCENRVEDDGFSEKVIEQISLKPRLAFVTNIYPTLGGLFGLLVFIFAKQNLSSIDFSSLHRLSHLISYQAHTFSTFYASYGTYTFMALFLMVIGFFVFQTEKN
jgi:hypothetical protein